MKEMITIILLVTLTLVAAVWDLVKKKIPNEIVFPGILAGLLLAMADRVLWGRIAGLAILFLFAYLVYKKFHHQIGLGDIKLWMMCEAFTGFEASLYIFTFSQVLLFLFALIGGKGKEMKNGLRNYLVYGTLLPGTKQYPFAPFFFIATVLYGLVMVLKGIPV